MFWCNNEVIITLFVRGIVDTGICEIMLICFAVLEFFAFSAFILEHILRYASHNHHGRHHQYFLSSSPFISVSSFSSSSSSSSSSPSLSSSSRYHHYYNHYYYNCYHYHLCHQRYHCYVGRAICTGWSNRRNALCEKCTGHRWIPLTKASDAELWCFLWFAPAQTVG